MSAATAEPDIATAATTDKTTFFIDQPLFARQQKCAGQTFIGAGNATRKKGEQLLPF
jgi:hypothetical protein